MDLGKNDQAKGSWHGRSRCAYTCPRREARGRDLRRGVLPQLRAPDGSRGQLLPRMRPRPKGLRAARRKDTHGRRPRAPTPANERRHRRGRQVRAGWARKLRRLGGRLAGDRRLGGRRSGAGSLLWGPGSLIGAPAPSRYWVVFRIPAEGIRLTERFVPGQAGGKEALLGKKHDEKAKDDKAKKDKDAKDAKKDKKEGSSY